MRIYRVEWYDDGPQTQECFSLEELVEFLKNNPTLQCGIDVYNTIEPTLMSDIQEKDLL